MEFKTIYISDFQHYEMVLKKVFSVKNHLWIGTADIKDLFIKKNISVFPFLNELSDLIKQKVEVRLIHAKEPGKNFRDDFDKNPVLVKHLERVLCPRVHFKILIFDMEEAYIGSANLTGAGIGMKGLNTRNFEAGILTNDPSLVTPAINHFDRIWMGTDCKKCLRKSFCGDPISQF